MKAIKWNTQKRNMGPKVECRIWNEEPKVNESLAIALESAVAQERERERETAGQLRNSYRNQRVRVSHSCI